MQTKNKKAKQQVITRCDECDEPIHKNLLEFHKKFAHSNTAKVSCPVCNENISPESLQFHIKTHRK